MSLEREAAFDTFNAKKLSPQEIAGSFVRPVSFPALAGADHCYVIGPRGSGKTTLLRMLTGESLMAWEADATRDAPGWKQRITYSSIFLPADELWASQTTPKTAKAAFTAQMLYAFVETMIYRTSPIDGAGNPVLHGVRLSNASQSTIVKHCTDVWGLITANSSFIGLQHALDAVLARIVSSPDAAEVFFRDQDALTLLTLGVKAFNREASQPHHRWALLLDEMELAPQDIHSAVIAFVRGGSSELILKVSMSPFDRYMHSYGAGGGPIPGHDFQTIYLSNQTRGDNARFTAGLWRESLRARGLPFVRHALDVPNSIHEALGRTASPVAIKEFLDKSATQDAAFAGWLHTRGIDLEQLDQLSYNQRSATLRKVLPLLIFRDAILTFRQGRPVRRSRKKSIEPFTGSAAIITMLEGNPRWIKSAFAHMLNNFDSRTGRVGAGFQFDALSTLANRFESLLRVLPQRSTSVTPIVVNSLVDAVADYMNVQNTSQFSSDPQNGFTVDGNTPPDVIDALVLGLYAGAFVHVRDRKSPAVLYDFRGQRFRLAYLLAVRDGREFPLRLGNSVKLSTVIKLMMTRSSLSTLSLFDLDYNEESRNANR
jgi:energy-coupling factor transporter ATP-binding protein EcfA2